jgi:hypothetical protein
MLGARRNPVAPVDAADPVDLHVARMSSRSADAFW